MSLSADILRRLAALNLPAEQFQTVLSIVADASETDPAKMMRSARNRRYYEKRLNKTSENVLNPSYEPSENVLASSELDDPRASTPARVLCGAEVNIPPIEPTALSPLPKARSAKPRRTIQTDEQPSSRDREAASNLSPSDFRQEWQKFRDHHLAKGSLMADWSAAWRTWLGNIGHFARAGLVNGHGPPRAATKTARVQALIDEANRCEPRSIPDEDCPIEASAADEPRFGGRVIGWAGRAG